MGILPVCSTGVSPVSTRGILPLGLGGKSVGGGPSLTMGRVPGTAALHEI